MSITTRTTFDCRPFTVNLNDEVQMRVPPNNGLQDDAPRAARA